MRTILFATASDFVANGTHDPLFVRGYGILDAAGALAADCNANGVLDSQDIQSGVSRDCNNNGTPDECECRADYNADGQLTIADFGLLADHDILALPFPEEYGGLGGELLSVCLAVEQLSRACATTGLIVAVQELGSLPITIAGTDEQKSRWFPKLASGEQLIAFALTEAEAGSDVAAARTRAVRDGEDYVIDGAKRFISHGSVADLLVVFAVTDPEAERHRRLSAFVVEVPTDGFAVTRIEHKMGLRGSPTAELAFDKVRVPAANLLGTEGDGFDIAMRTLDRSRPGIAAQAVGIAQGALEVATAYARDRKQFGQRIGDFQMIGGDAGGHGCGDGGRAPAAVQGLRRDRCGRTRREPVVGPV